MFEGCCFCFTLRTGGLIIGWLGVVGCIIEIFANVPLEGPIFHTELEAAYLIFIVTVLAIGVIINALLIFGVHKVCKNL